jgi:hypothetical protein
VILEGAAVAVLYDLSLLLHSVRREWLAGCDMILVGIGADAKLPMQQGL